MTKLCLKRLLTSPAFLCNEAYARLVTPVRLRLPVRFHESDCPCYECYSGVPPAHKLTKNRCRWCGGVDYVIAENHRICGTCQEEAEALFEGWLADRQVDAVTVRQDHNHEIKLDVDLSPMLDQPIAFVADRSLCLANFRFRRDEFGRNWVAGDDERRALAAAGCERKDNEPCLEISPDGELRVFHTGVDQIMFDGKWKHALLPPVRNHPYHREAQLTVEEVYEIVTANTPHAEV